MLAVWLVLAVAGPVVAKADAVVRLDEPIGRDALPGSTVEIGFRVAIATSDGEVPLTGTPIVLRLVPPGSASPTEAVGSERPPGSGHYVASVTVPEGGIARVEAGIRGETCVPDAGCTRSDIPLRMDGPTIGEPAGAVRPGASVLPGSAATPGVAAPSATAPTPATGPDVPMVAAAVAVAVGVLGAVGLVILRRRRTAGTAVGGTA
jgi:hypothetical protein